MERQLTFLDKAAMDWAKKFSGKDNRTYRARLAAFKAGAEWMLGLAEQCSVQNVRMAVPSEKKGNS